MRSGPIAELASALSHPLRIEILLAYHEHGRLAPAQIANMLDASTGVVSYHIRLLNRGPGLLRVAGTKQVRGAIAHFYLLTAQGDRAVRAIQALAQLEGSDRAQS